jgi:hypothetical protein
VKNYFLRLFSYEEFLILHCLFIVGKIREIAKTNSAGSDNIPVAPVAIGAELPLAEPIKPAVKLP